MNKSYQRMYPANREFIKNFRHNKQSYTLCSIYDANNKYDFDAAVRYNPIDNKYDFNKAVKRKSIEYIDSIDLL